jgi:hypothetical protein
VPQRQFELGAKERKRRPQLVAGVGDEAPLAREGILEPAEHLVQRESEPFDLVARMRHRQALAGALRRDRGGPATHRVDGTEREAGQEIAGDGGDEQCDRAGDQELVAQAVQGLGPVLERRADDQHVGRAAAPRHRDGEEARRLVQPPHPLPVAEDRPLERAADVGGAQHRRGPERARPLDHRAVSRDELRVALAALHEGAVRRGGQAAVRVGDHGGEVVRAHPQLAVQSVGEVAAEARVDVPPAAGQDNGHRDRERCGDPEPDRDPAHAVVSTRSR